MRDVTLKIIQNKKIAKDTYKMVLQGSVSDCARPGGFVNVKIDGYYLRRPISVCDVNKNKLTLIYKVIGSGTEQMTKLKDKINILTNLGNNYNIKNAKKNNLLIAGGCAVPPIYLLAKNLVKTKKNITVVLGFNDKEEIFYVNEFKKLGVKVIVTTVDGSVGIKGYPTDVINKIKYDYFFACGPMPMMQKLFNTSKTSGEFSLEERMGCGFGACMGCTIQTKHGPKSVCKDGPIFKKEDLLW